MNKKTIVICGIILVLAIALTILFNSNNNNVLRENGVTYALTVDGASQNKFPSKGMYRVDTECTNAKCRWDYEAWKLYIEDVTGIVSCNISFTTISKTYLNNKIIGLSGTTQGNGQVVNENGYRYEGQDPNNYVWFNNELWRIIGVFDSSSEGISNTNLVKIIRNDSVGGLAWDSDENTWGYANLNSLLTGYYLLGYNATGISICNGYGSQSNAKCNYGVNGIKAAYREMIKEVDWRTARISNGSITAGTMYGYENGSTTHYGYIGLMYASDYGFAVPAANCSRTTNLDSYHNGYCTLNNWLYNGGDEWTLTAVSTDTYQVFNVNSNGRVGYTYSSYGRGVRPSLYLYPSVYVIDGDGSITNPYIIGM